MSQTPPFRSRPNLHLSLSTPLIATASQTSHDVPIATSSSASRVRPFAVSATSYSPFRSAGLKPPTPYGDSIHFSPKRSHVPAFLTLGNNWFRFRRVWNGRLLVLLILLCGIVWWVGGGFKKELNIVRLGVSEFGLGNQRFHVEITKDLQFFPAANSKIHYVGRWTSTPNRLRKDGAFPGVYFDISFTNTTTLLLSLHNAPQSKSSSKSTTSQAAIESPLKTQINPSRLSFRHSPLLDEPASPVSLLARVDQEEYALLPNSSLLVSIRSNDLDANAEHSVRVIVPMTDSHGNDIVQLEGIWLSKYGKLIPVEGSLLDEDFEDEDALYADNPSIGEKHKTGLDAMMRSGSAPDKEPIGTSEAATSTSLLRERKKVLEVITDNRGSLSSSNRGKRAGGADGLLAGVMGWEYLLGEMFSIDHVAIGVDNMCLTQDCIGGAGYPSGMGDVFFRSGPPQSPYFEHPWMFQSYVPDVLIMNLGSSDNASFTTHVTEYQKTVSGMQEQFEDTYVALIKAIRQLAYPKHPSVIHSERTGSPDLVPANTPSAIPIFVLRPFRGQLEHATQNVVNRLRAAGDKAVFWLDTSGWLAEDINNDDSPDFSLDESTSPPTWRLTEEGNQRVAIILHMHICRYLATLEDQCAFLPPTTYQGKVFDSEEASFDRYLENDKEKQLKELFWGTKDQAFDSPEETKAAPTVELASNQHEEETVETA